MQRVEARVAHEGRQHLIISVRGVGSAPLSQWLFEQKVFGVQLALVGQHGVRVIKAEPTRADMSQIQVGRFTRVAEEGLIEIVRDVVVDKWLGVGSRRLFKRVEHLAGKILIFISLAVPIAFEGITKEIRGDDTKKVSDGISITIACAACDAGEVNAYVDAGVSKRSFSFREVVVFFNSPQLT